MFRKRASLSVFLVGVLFLSFFSVIHALYAEYKIKPADGAADDAFGEAVSTDGIHIIAGAPEQNNVAGAAYIFEWNGNTYTEIAKLTASDAAPYAKYGEAVAISGDYAFVGAYGADLAAGAVYVYQWNGTSWPEIAKLVASDSASQDYFGYELAFDGINLIVGAPFNQDFGNRTGSAYIFNEVGGTWLETTKLLASDATFWSEFGRDVDIDGNVAIVGSPASNQASYIFRNNGSGWFQEAKLISPNIPASNTFGEAVAISGDNVVVGDSNRLVGSVQTGSAFVFNYSNGSWMQAAMLLGSDVTTEARFGDGVTIDGTTILVGAHLMYGTGAYYVYEFAETWTEVDIVRASDGGTLDHFAWEVALVDDIHVAGSLGDDDNGPTSGSAYVYRPASPTAIGIQNSTFRRNLIMPGSLMILSICLVLITVIIIQRYKNQSRA